MTSTAIDTAMILAAGFGTRMGALTADRPKPLLEVAGKSLIWRTLDECVKAGVSRAVVNTHYRGDMIEGALASRDDLKIIISEETEILETGGGIAKALPFLGAKPFFSVNSDAIWTGPRPLPTLMSEWREDMGALLHLTPRENAIGYTRDGDFFMDVTGRLTRRVGASKAPFVFTGAQVIRPEVFVNAPSGAFSLNVIWDQLIASGRLFGVVHQGAWVDVGTPEGLRLAEAELLK